MKFKPGQSGNPEGRPKGSPNKITVEGKEILARIIAQELKDLPARLDELSAKERVEVLTKLLPYVMVKPKIEESVEQERYAPPTVIIQHADGTKIANGGLFPND